jgi:hypothetical protein
MWLQKIKKLNPKGIKLSSPSRSKFLKFEKQVQGGKLCPNKKKMLLKSFQNVNIKNDLELLI